MPSRNKKSKKFYRREERTCGQAETHGGKLGERQQVATCRFSTFLTKKGAALS
jgi:hypothetical protein